MRTYVRGRRVFCAWRVDLAGRQQTAESKTCIGVSTLLLALALLGGIAGAARGDCSPHQLVKLLGAGEPTKEFFGYSVAVSGDTAVVGEPGVLSCSLGAAYVFRFSGREWVQEAELTAAHPTPGGRFGWSVAISDDTIVVGEPDAYNLGSWSGTAYVFQKPPGGWVDVTHAEVSAMVLSYWGLPDLICKAVNLQHSANVGTEDDATHIARILNGSDRIAKLLCEIPDVSEAGGVCAEAAKFMGVDLTVISRLLGEIESDVEELAAILHIDVIPSTVYDMIAKSVQERLAVSTAD